MRILTAHHVSVSRSDEQQQLERLKLRSGLSDEDARRRVDAQMPIARKRAMATHVIDNSGDVDVTRRQVRDAGILTPAYARSPLVPVVLSRSKGARKAPNA